MTLKLSNRSDVSTFRALDNLAAVNKRIAAGEDIVRLEAGQPCFGMPEPVLAYARERLSIDKLQGYTDALGMQLLRGRIAAYIHQRYGVEIDYGRIAVTAGSSPGLVMAFIAAFDAGDTVAVCTPTYAAYMNTLKALDINIVEIPTGPETNYQPTAALLESYGKKFDGLIICSPSNPTGTVIDAGELKKICAWCDERGVRLVSDEAYHGITYERPAETALKFSKNVIVMNTFSKYFAMTGWRMGWMSVPEEMAIRIKRLSESLYVSPPTISQHAAYKIFDHLSDLDGYVAHYKANRDILREGLPKAGLSRLSAADGAFYFYADLSDYTNDAEGFCRAMVSEAGVSCTAGVDFDPTRGHTAMRISYAGTAADMHKACERLGHWLASGAQKKRAF
jgi:aspartate/methionine/tyrosine aminotransferase